MAPIGGSACGSGHNGRVYCSRARGSGHAVEPSHSAQQLNSSRAQGAIDNNIQQLQLVSKQHEGVVLVFGAARGDRTQGRLSARLSCVNAANDCIGSVAPTAETAASSSSCSSVERTHAHWAPGTTRSKLMLKQRWSQRKNICRNLNLKSESAGEEIW